jgi:hypothetical protein
VALGARLDSKSRCVGSIPTSGAISQNDPGAAVNKTVLAACLNEWMRRYIDQPHRFVAEFQTVQGFVQDRAVGGGEPLYGVEGAEFLERIAVDLGLMPAGTEA